eukprot:11139140-Ditylum_brightwellii.AAC.1
MKFNIIVDCDVGAPGHGKDVVDGWNAVDKDRTNKSNLHTSTARAKREENAKHKARHYTVQEKKDVKHKDVRPKLGEAEL